MTDRPYTDDDLRAEAANQHLRLTGTLDDPAAVGDHMIGWPIPSTAVDLEPETGEPLEMARAWNHLPREDFKTAQKEVCGLLTGAADVSRWAVDLGADHLQPGTRAIDIGWNNGPLQARLHIAFAADMPEDERDQLVTDLADAIAGTVPVR